MTVDVLMELADKWACLREARFTVAALGKPANNGPVDAARAALETALRASIATPEVEAVVGAARFYAEPANWLATLIRQSVYGRPAMEDDRGQTARTALLALDAARAGQVPR